MQLSHTNTKDDLISKSAVRHAGVLVHQNLRDDCGRNWRAMRFR